MTTSDWHLLSRHPLAFSGLLARYKPHFFLAGLCLLAGIALLALDLTDLPGTTFWAGTVLLFAIPWLIPVFLAYLRSVQLVCVYEEGLAWTARGQVEIHPWEDVREVYRANRFFNRFWQQAEVTLILKKIPPVRFDQSLADFFALASLVEAQVAEQRLPDYRQALVEGGARFGPVVLERTGLGINGQRFTWGEIEEITLYDAGLVVAPFAYAEYTGEHAPFCDVPNYLILLRLLEELGHPATPAERSVFLHGRTKPRQGE